MLCLVLHMISSTFFPELTVSSFYKIVEFTTFVCADAGVQTVT